MTVLNPNKYLPGVRLFSGNALNESLGNPLVSYEGSITAHAGGGKTNAYQLGARLNQIDTVATGADSVKLPASVPGASIVVINNGANAMQVFGANSDTINGVATGTGISQPAGTSYTYRCVEANKWLTQTLTGNGSFTDLAVLGNLTVTGTARVSGLFAASASGVSAAGTNAATATALTANNNQLTTVGASTGVALPAAVVGMAVMIANKGANDVKVYGNGSDTIDGTAGATGVTLGHTAGTNSCIYFCCVTGTWISAKLGAVSS